MILPKLFAASQSNKDGFRLTKELCVEIAERAKLLIEERCMELAGSYLLCGDFVTLDYNLGIGGINTPLKDSLKIRTGAEEIAREIIKEEINKLHTDLGKFKKRMEDEVVPRMVSDMQRRFNLIDKQEEASEIGGIVAKRAE